MDADRKILHVNPNSLRLDSYRLAMKLYDDDFRPELIIALSRGGDNPGAAVDEFYRYKGIEVKHMPLKVMRYRGISRPGEGVNIYGMEPVIDVVNSVGEGIALVDDVFDEGITAEEVLKRLMEGSSSPKGIRIATIYWKPSENKTHLKPHYYVHEVDGDVWIDFPYELQGLTEAEIRAKGNDFAKLVLDRKPLHPTTP